MGPVMAMLLCPHSSRKTQQERRNQARHGSPALLLGQSLVSHSSASSPGSASARRNPRKLLPRHQQQHTTRSLQRQRVPIPHHNTIRRLCSSKVPAWLLSVLLMASKAHGLLNRNHLSAKRHPRTRCQCTATSILSRVAMQVRDSLCTMRRAQV